MSKQKYSIVGFATLCLLFGATSFFSEQTTSVELEELSYSSFTEVSATRSVHLGKAVPTEKEAKKEVAVILKDPAMSQKWGLDLTNSQKAWRISRGSKQIIVAIVDTGIDVNHPDIKNNLWTNPGETGKDAKGRNKANNGVDDDGNGYIDDIHGWNFVHNDHNLEDNHGHGTHIAGIVGAEGGNGVGISGVAPRVSLMVLKYYDPKASGMNNLTNTVKAIDYATKMNAHIINYSGGGLEASEVELQAIKKANDKGILFVAAAGNEKSNSDIKKYYPADYDLPNIISVTAIDKGKNILPTSNYGSETVDVAAPGNNIYSTLPSGQYGYMTGTSQATAFVSGVAALVMADNEELKKANRVIKYLTKTGDFDPKLAGKTRYRYRLNSYKALANKDGDMSLTGVLAENTGNMGHHEFASDPNARLKAQSEQAPAESQITMFGQQIQQHLDVIPPAQAATSKDEQRGPSARATNKPL